MMQRERQILSIILLNEIAKESDSFITEVEEIIEPTGDSVY